MDWDRIEDEGTETMIDGEVKVTSRLDEEDTVAIVDLEAQVIALADRLKLARMRDFDVPRDYLGTLHVNLCNLIRRATVARDDLERSNGFIR